MRNGRRASLAVLAVLGVVWIAAGVSAQPRWVHVKPAAQPIAMYYPYMAYDTHRKVAVHFTSNSFTNYVEIWEWDGISWTRRLASNQTQGGEYAMAYDPGQRRVIICGGTSTTLQTLAWNGTTLTRLVTKNAPPIRLGHSMVYDASRRKIVLFGGRFGYNNYRDDTWEWDGTDWTQRKPLVYPAGREHFGLAYDARNKQVVLFGGQGNIVLDDTWVWQGTTWTKKATTLMPKARLGPQMVYDTWRKRVVLYGGEWGFRAYFGDTWEWDGAAWTPVKTPKLTGKSQAAVAYHAATRRIVVFAGYGDTGTLGPAQETWEFRRTHLTGSGTPRPGTVVIGALTSPDDAGHLYQMASAFGTGPVFVGPLAVGLQMDPLFLITASDQWPHVFRNYRGRLDGSGQATVKIAIPALTALIGQPIHSAFLVFDPKASPPPRAVSNTFSFTILR